ncbi:hypothetical protein K449DRAFT_218714 [Hypoxylon sp. EC38]|nr:hypothetical protein K449DRAFT_218714 [Hypoxylon sp. EC38]
MNKNFSSRPLRRPIISMERGRKRGHNREWDIRPSHREPKKGGRKVRRPAPPISPITTTTTRFSQTLPHQPNRNVSLYCFFFCFFFLSFFLSFLCSSSVVNTWSR